MMGLQGLPLCEKCWTHKQLNLSSLPDAPGPLLPILGTSPRCPLRSPRTEQCFVCKDARHGGAATRKTQR